jgi:hypothetical protein
MVGLAQTRKAVNVSAVPRRLEDGPSAVYHDARAVDIARLV